MNKSLAIVVMITELGIAPLFAQVSRAEEAWLPSSSVQPPANTSPVPAAVPAGNEEWGARLARLEADNRRMQTDNQRMETELLALQGQTAQPPLTAGDEDVTMPQVQSEVRKLMWSKGDYRVVPYGILWGNSVYSTQRTNVGTTTFFVESPTKQNDDEFIADGRNTRLGLDVLGPRVPLLGCAQSGGKVEIDFQGNFTGTENKGGLLLRHAYAEVKNDDFRLLAGQTWDVISPLNPGTLMYSVGWDAGNIGYRRAQVRAERFLAVSDTELLTLQSSVNQNCFPDGIANATGKAAPWPIIEGRAGWTFGERTGPDALPTTVGVSGHVGQTEFNYNTAAITLNNQQRCTWSFNADLRIPITQRFGVQGEFFTGQDLSPFYGGIGQGIDPTTLEAIRSTGGWGELWCDWTPCFHSRVGYMLDDPNNNDLHTAGERSYNQVFYGNVSCDLTKQFLVGLEVSSWKTQYITWAPGDSVRCEFVVKYGF